MKGLILGVSAVAAAAVLVSYFVVPVLFPATTVALPYQEGMSGAYADGTCTYSQFSLTRPAILTGDFVANRSTVFQVVNGSQNPMAGGACALSRSYEYSSGSVKEGAVNLTLGAGSYTAIFAFGNLTGGQTSLQITHPFVAEYRASLSSPGELCVSLSCRQNDRGAQGPDGTN